MDLRQIATGIALGEDGIWRSRAETTVSYPEGGNEFYSEVEEHSFWFSHRNRCLIETLKSFPPSDPIVDVGGGNGYVAAAIQRAGWPLVLLEPGASGARNARRRGIRDVVRSTFEDAEFLPGSIGAIGAFDVVEHIEDDLSFLRSAAERLRNGGRMYLTVPAFPSLWSQQDLDDGHYRRYTEASLRSVVERAGFEIEYSTYIFGFLPVPIFLLRSIPYRLGIVRPSRITTEHRSPGGASGRLLEYFLNRELALIRAGRRIRFGSSCLAVAVKRSGTPSPGKEPVLQVGS